MITNPNAHGFCPRVAPQEGHPKTHKFKGTIWKQTPNFP
jgi:hypothetical protein